MSHVIPAALAAASLLVAAGASATADDATPQRVEVRKQIVLTADVADTADFEGRTVMVKRRIVNGDESTTIELRPSEDATTQVFTIGDIQVGETRAIRSESGDWLDVTRTAEGLELAVDGETIKVPLPGEHAGMLNQFQNAIVVKHVGDDADQSFNWVGEDGESVDVEVLHLGDAAHRMMFIGAGAQDVNFDELESLKGLDPEVRDKVVEALHEILSKQHAPMIQHVVIEDGEGGDVQAGPQRIRVKRLHGTDAQ